MQTVQDRSHKLIGENCISIDPLRLNLLTGGEKDVLQETEMCFDQFCSHTTHQHLWRINTAIDDLLSTIVSDNEVLTAN